MLLGLGKLHSALAQELLRAAAAAYKEIGDTAGEAAALELLQPSSEETPLHNGATQKRA